MLILLAVLAVGVFLLNRAPRLESSAAEVNANPAVRAYVDGKPVKSYLLEK